MYNSKLISMAINKIMLDGKKSIAQKIFYDALKIVKEKTSENPVEVFEKALSNILPQLELKSRRIGGGNYQVPVEVSAARKTTLGIRWLINYARLRNDKTMEEKLAHEIIDAANNTGGAVKKKEDVHRMAEANRTFSHYRF
ncbi:30S ribosomal protein S7 [Mycoplasma sp. (ex Biomphalaria glabrata)]|nr:30S ribosomal protein S7 [Mycoplasma sp. (ex Biomphalaria glabrata)]